MTVGLQLLVEVQGNRANVHGADERKSDKTVLPDAEHVNALIVLEDLLAVTHVLRVDGLQVTCDMAAEGEAGVRRAVEPMIILRRQVDDTVAQLVAALFDGLAETGHFLIVLV